MENKYLLKPILGTIKEGFILEDENGTEVYHAQMTKFHLFTSSPYEFISNITGLHEEHKIGKTVTIEESGPTDFFSTKSSFKYDGERIWDYLHKKGIRINSNLSNNKIGMTYEVSLEGKKIATISSSSPKGKSIITTDKYYDVVCDPKSLDIVFLVAFSIAKTDQVFYD